MKKYVRSTTVTNVSNITLVARTTTGITITNPTTGNQTISDLWTRDSSEINNLNKFNLLSYYKIRQLSYFPESESNNTLITNTGLILILNSTYLTIYDIYERESTDYDSIDPVGYDSLLSYTELNNSVNKRVILYSGYGYDFGEPVAYGETLPTFNAGTSPEKFVVFVGGSATLYVKGVSSWSSGTSLDTSGYIINIDYGHMYFSVVSGIGRVFTANSVLSDKVNSLVFIDSTGYHFNSLNDFNAVLNKDDYGYYLVSQSDWIVTYNQTSTFSVLKRPFLRFYGPAGFNVYFMDDIALNRGGTTIVEQVSRGATDAEGNQDVVYLLKDLNVSSADKVLEYKVSTEKASGFFILY